MPAKRRERQGRRLTIAGLIAVSAATLLMLAWAAFPTAAFADGTINWTGQGFRQDCPNGGHWNFQNSEDVTSATLHVNGETIVMTKQGNHWTANSSGPITSGTTASVDFVGDAPDGFLTLSSCLGGTTTTPGTTTETTTTETTTTETTTTETTTPGTTTQSTTSQTTTQSTSPPSTSTTPGTTSVSGTSVTPPGSSTPPQGTSVSGRTVTPGGTAFTGLENVVPLGALTLLLMTGGSGLMWAGARRRRRTEEGDEE